jgi:glycosyltransferase involved in cell wall biosynthesis
MLISVVVPACAAEATLGRAVRSLIAQSWTDWEGIIVCDDGVDYAALARAQGFFDARLRFVSTGCVRSGCHNARNVGLAVTRGELIAALDADDLFHPERLARLAPIAAREGAAVDNPAVVSEISGETLAHAFTLGRGESALDLARFLDLNVPLFPLVRREHAQPRVADIEYAEDVVANVRLIDRIGRLPALPETLFEYHVVPGSACHSDNSADVFDRAYGEILARLAGDGLGLSPASHAIAIAGFERKRALNRAFAEARRSDASLDFQTFCARRHEAVAAHS